MTRFLGIFSVVAAILPLHGAYAQCRHGCPAAQQDAHGCCPAASAASSGGGAGGTHGGGHGAASGHRTARGGAVEVYSNDFENAIDTLSNWSQHNVAVTPTGGRRFLGQFSNDRVMLIVDSMAPHQSVELEFDLYVIASMDGSPPASCNCGPDVFSVSVGAQPPLFRTTFSNIDHPAWSTDSVFPQSYPSQVGGPTNPPRTGAREVNSLGYVLYGQAVDSVYHLTLRFPHTGPTLALTFAGEGMQAIADESWGLDNVVVRALPR